MPTLIGSLKVTPGEAIAHPIALGLRAWVAEWTGTTLAPAARAGRDANRSTRYSDGATALTTTGLRATLHANHVGFAVGLSGQGRQNMKARQALGAAPDVQVQNIE